MRMAGELWAGIKRRDFHAWRMIFVEGRDGKEKSAGRKTTSGQMRKNHADSNAKTTGPLIAKNHRASNTLMSLF